MKELPIVSYKYNLIEGKGILCYHERADIQKNTK